MVCTEPTFRSIHDLWFKPVEGKDAWKSKILKVHFPTRMDSWDRVTKIMILAFVYQDVHVNIKVFHVERWSALCKTPLKSELKLQICLLSGRGKVSASGMFSVYSHNSDRPQLFTEHTVRLEVEYIYIVYVLWYIYI